MLRWGGSHRKVDFFNHSTEFVLTYFFITTKTFQMVINKNIIIKC